MKTILVLEDESNLRNLLQRVLARQGYTVLEAASAEEAIRVFIENRRHIDLLIADLTLPEVSGIEAALLLRNEIPGLPVILSSGYPVTSWTSRDTADLGRLGADTVSILPKPFSPRGLLNSVGELIPRPDGAQQKTA